MSCLFCKIVAGELSSTILYQNEQIIAFKDIHPQAPHHVLIIPRKHIATVQDITDEDSLLIGNMVQTAKLLASELNIALDGYRLIFNCNSWGGQEVYHLHLHLLGGRPMQWPPG